MTPVGPKTLTAASRSLTLSRLVYWAVLIRSEPVYSLNPLTKASPTPSMDTFNVFLALHLTDGNRRPNVELLISMRTGRHVSVARTVGRVFLPLRLSSSEPEV